MLAQLRGGVVEGIVQRWDERAEKRLGAKLLGVEAGRNLLGGTSVEQTTTLQDVLLDLFEEAAEDSTLFSPLVMDDPDAWRDGRLHSHVKPGELVRVTAPTQIIDAEHVGDEIMRALEVMESVAFFEEAQNPTPLPAAVPPQAGGKRGKGKVDPEAFRQAATVARVESILGIPLEGAVAIKSIFQKVLGGGISLRVFPCGAANRDLALAGRLASRESYLRDEQNTLFAKYGWGVSDWTVIAQIATVPQPSDEGEAASPEVVQENGASPARAATDEEDMPERDESTEGLDRAEFEGMGIDFMKTLADAGVISAPRFPGLTITPIAIYRDVPLTTGSEDTEPS